ncbi:MAG: sulfite exporter TauE/SafE family protein [Alphaproteobacteria bacterium]
MSPDMFAHPFLVMGLVLALATTGAFAGTMAGMFGVGGGIIIVPVLSEILRLLDVPYAAAMPVAVATSLATIVPTSLAALRTHARHGAIDLAILRVWGPVIVVGALIGSLLTNYVHGQFISLIFGGLILLTAYRFWRHTASDGVTGTMPHPAVQRLLAGVIGGISALLGLGGGLIGVAVLRHCGFTLHRAIGTASNFGYMVAIPGVIVYLLSPAPTAIPYGTIGLVHPMMVGLLLPGAVICAPLGARLAHRLPVAPLQTGFAIVLLVLGCKMVVASLF